MLAGRVGATGTVRKFWRVLALIAAVLAGSVNVVAFFVLMGLDDGSSKSIIEHEVQT